MRILLIEDERMTSLVFQSELKSRGHEVIAVERLSDATRELSAAVFDLIICDGRLHGESGYLYAKMLADQGKNVVQFTSDRRHVLPGVRCIEKSLRRGLEEELNDLLEGNSALE